MPSVIGKQKLFPEVKSVDDIVTEEWLEVARGATVIIGAMGSNFSMTKSDMEGNIKKVRDKYETDKEKFKKFADLLTDESEKKESKKDPGGTIGGLWLKRGLEYLCEVFFGIIKGHLKSKQAGDASSDGDVVKKACQEAYEITLKAHHNFMMKGIVKVALYNSPKKKDLFAELTKGEHCEDEELVAEMTAYEKAMRQYTFMLNQLDFKESTKDKGIEQRRDPAQ